MSVNLIQYAFVAGEISPTFFGRTDLEKYDLGVELAKNWFVDYQGGLSTRPGTRFCEYIKDANLSVRLEVFNHGESVINSYLLLFGHEYLRFLSGGQYVMEGDKVITSVTSANPGVVTSAAHGYATGDWVKIAGRTFEVGVTTANTFSLLDPYGASFSTVGQTDILSATVVARIYTVVTPWDSDRLPGISVFQHLNNLYITSGSFRPRKLTHVDHTNWTLEVILASNDIPRPSSLDATSPVDEDNAVTFAITSVDADGNESLPVYKTATGLCEFDSGEDVISFTWAKATGINLYNLYRTPNVKETNFTSGQAVGYIGQSRSLSFIDKNIVPDFTLTPPVGYSPFENNSILFIEITAGGSGYDPVTATVSITDPDGIGFLGYPVIGPTGAIEGVIIISGGREYSSPTVNFGGGGVGATATVTRSPSSGQNPAKFCVFQQRGVYAATPNQPLTLWGSIPGEFDNFSYSEITVESDSYEFTLDSGKFSAIAHIIPSRGGLLVLTQTGVWILTGGNELAVTPLNVLADPQIYKGVSEVPPISIDAEFLYVESKGSTVRLLSYNDVTKVYGGASMSILANHLFDSSRRIISWCFSESPYSVIWTVRSDGALLAFTYVAEQKVAAWTQNWTRGLFRDVKCVQEGIEDHTYFIIIRYLPDGTQTKYLETFANRAIQDVEDSWCLDAALNLPSTSPNSAIGMSAASGTVVITAVSGVFSASDVGKVWRGGGGKGLVTAYTSSTVISVELVRPITNLVPESTIPHRLGSGAWTLDSLVSSIDGLWHLEGQEVIGLADGSVVGPFVVEDGSVELGMMASRVVIGLPYTCVARTLPMTAQGEIIEDKRKRIVGIGLRTKDTRGLKLGATLDSVRPMKERSDEPYGEPTRLRSNMDYEIVEASWDQNGQMYFVQEFPLPATILGLVQDFELGDTLE